MGILQDIYNGYFQENINWVVGLSRNFFRGIVTPFHRAPRLAQVLSPPHAVTSPSRNQVVHAVVPRENLRVAVRESMITNVIGHLGTMLLIENVLRPSMAFFLGDTKTDYAAFLLHCYVNVNYMIKNMLIQIVLVRSGTELARSFKMYDDAATNKKSEDAIVTALHHLKDAKNDDLKKIAGTPEFKTALAKLEKKEDDYEMVRSQVDDDQGYSCKKEHNGEEIDFTWIEIYSLLNYPINSFLAKLVTAITGTPVAGFIFIAFINGNSISEYMLRDDEKLCHDHRHQELAREKSKSFGIGLLMQSSVLLLSYFIDALPVIRVSATKVPYLNWVYPSSITEIPIFNMVYQLITVLTLLKTQSEEPMPERQHGTDILYPQRFLTYQALEAIHRKLSDDKVWRDRAVTLTKFAGSAAFIGLTRTTERSSKNLLKIPGLVFYLDRYGSEIAAQLQPIKKYLEHLEVGEKAHILEKLRCRALKALISLAPMVQKLITFLGFIPQSQLAKTLGTLLETVDPHVAIDKTKKAIDLIENLLKAHGNLELPAAAYKAPEEKIKIIDHPELDMTKHEADAAVRDVIETIITGIETSQKKEAEVAEAALKKKAELEEFAKKSKSNIIEDYGNVREETEEPPLQSASILPSSMFLRVSEGGETESLPLADQPRSPPGQSNGGWYPAPPR